MKEYFATKLVNASASLATAYGLFVLEEDESLTPQKRADVKRMIGKFAEATEFLGLVMTVKSATRFLEAIDSENSAVLEKQFDDMHSRFQDEAENLPLFYVHQDALAYYNKTNFFGDEFKTNFPTANTEISEAGNCFAFDRYTASVFHLMRALEVVLKVLFQTLGLPPLTTAGERNWNGILRQVKDKLDADQAIPDHEFYENAYAFLVAAKNPMRNATMHVDAVYDEASATRLFYAIGAFMRHIATKLKETP